MDPQHYNPYHHPYYRVGAGVRDHHHHHHHHHHQSVESAAQAAAVQSRILEMRKEKSRDAARSRRGKENHEFYELAKLLPLPAAITSQLGIMNKASIIRLTISYLKLREFTLNGDPSWGPSSLSLTNNSLKTSKLNNHFDVHQGTHILQSLDGFAFALGQDGRFLYISETVSIYLGLSQVEMTGSSVFDYTHQQDHAELAEQLGITPSSSTSQLSSSPLPPASVGSNTSSESDTPSSFPSSNTQITANSQEFLERQFCIRMKSTLTKRGCQHFKSSGYRVVHVISHLRPEVHQRREANNFPLKMIGMVAVAIALPPPSVNELRLESDMFVMRLGLDFKIVHCEPRISELLDYSVDELTGRNMYSLVHGQDVIQLRKCHLDLIHKGQVMSKYYRIINKNGGYTWVQTCATLICSNNAPSNSKSSGNSSTNGNDDQDQSIISVNYVISGLEHENVILDASQLPANSASSSSSSPPLSSKRSPPKRSTPSPASPATSQTSLITHTVQRIKPEDPPSLVTANGSPDSPMSGSNDISKRRRYTSSPVRPWKSPSPHSISNSTTLCTLNSTNNSSSGPNPASNLLRHISVIRETPPILKPQVVAPSYHPHHHPAHYHPHQPLVDPYTAYHFYKNGGAPGTGMTTATTSPGSASAPHHNWGAYN